MLRLKELYPALITIKTSWDCLAVCTLEAFIKSSKNFPGDFEVNQRRAFTWQSKENIFGKNLKLLVLSLMRRFCELQPTVELQGIMLNLW